MPKVCVIVPVYGVEKYIERCARSLFEQTLDDIEYLFIDDCTPDDSIIVLKRVLEEYPQRISQVIFHRMEQNSGQAKVREWGLRNATGDFVIHCDSDDWVEADMYKTMYQHALDTSSDVVICGYNITDGSSISRVGKGAIVKSKESILDDIIKVADWTVWNKMVKREIYKTHGFIFPTQNMGEDMVVTVQSLYYANRITTIENSFYNYFYNPSSITRDYSDEKLLKICQQCFENVKLLQTFIDTNATVLSDSYIYVKLLKKNMLRPLLKKGYYDLWLNTFPEINSKVLFNSHVSLKDKLIFILLRLRIFV